MLNNRDIIILSLQSWDTELECNIKHLAFEFAKNNRVLYVNGPLDRMKGIKQANNPRVQKRKRVIRGEEDELILVSDNIWNLYPRVLIETINQISIDWLFDLLNYRNNYKLAKCIQRAVERLGFKDYIVFNDSDVFRSYYLKNLLHPHLYIYYSRNHFIQDEYWRVQGKRIESKHWAKADIVMAHSSYIARLAREVNPFSFFVGQGFDTTTFSLEQHYPKPAEMENIAQPIIGFMGTMTTLRLDVEVLEFVARSHPDWSIVLVGPKDNSFDRCRLTELPNVHYLGNKDAAAFPAYLKYFDVAINPQVINYMTNANYPRKVDEYLAMGKPVVVFQTESIDYFEDEVFIAQNKEQFAELIETALKEDNRENEVKRYEYAQQHTWEQSADLIFEHILDAEMRLKKRYRARLLMRSKRF